MYKLLILCAAIVVTGIVIYPGATRSDDVDHSEVQADETVVFFRTAARLDKRNRSWQVPIHGWIYEPEDSVARKALFESILENQFDLAPNEQTESNFSRRINLMIADSERDKRIVIELAGRRHVLPASGPNGQFAATLTIPAADVEKSKKLNRLGFAAVMKDGDKRNFLGEVLLVPPVGISVISDIDDTVKISNVTDRKKLLEQTFLLDFSTAPGMAALYGRWSQQGTSFHFVSSSPWQLYAPLVEFLDANNFPPATLSLKSVRFRDETLFDLFKKGTETKPPAIEKILNAYPDRQFVLVGDSGEQDPEVYAALTMKYPQQILRVFIRNVTQESANNERFKAVFSGIDTDRWMLFDDPRTIELPIAN